MLSETQKKENFGTLILRHDGLNKDCPKAIKDIPQILGQGFHLEIFGEYSKDNKKIHYEVVIDVLVNINKETIEKIISIEGFRNITLDPDLKVVTITFSLERKQND